MRIKSKVKRKRAKMAAKRSKKRDYTYAVGRRRRATARVRLYKGRKQSLVDEKLIGEYFPGEVNAKAWMKPFELCGVVGKYYVTVKVSGGGKKGQLEAVVHGIARAFNSLDEKKFREPLKKAGLLTRDPRVRQRRMVGTGGKARRQKQSPKR